MSNDRFLIIKNCIEKWDIIQEFVKTYSTYFERVLLIQNLNDEVVGLHLEFSDNEYDDNEFENPAVLIYHTIYFHHIIYISFI